MTIRLVKRSMPGWTREFSEEGELKGVLYDHICIQCLDDVGSPFSIEELLDTDCGLEFSVEY
jgi:hypothetical protein